MIIKISDPYEEMSRIKVAKLFPPSPPQIVFDEMSYIYIDDYTIEKVEISF